MASGELQQMLLVVPVVSAVLKDFVRKVPTMQNASAEEAPLMPCLQECRCHEVGSRGFPMVGAEHLCLHIGQSQQCCGHAGLCSGVPSVCRGSSYNLAKYKRCSSAAYPCSCATGRCCAAPCLWQVKAMAAEGMQDVER